MIQEADWDYFRQGMAMLAEAVSKEASKPWIAAHWQVLRGATREEFGYAVERQLETGKFLPAPAEMFEHVQALRQKLGDEAERLRQRQALIDPPEEPRRRYRDGSGPQSIGWGGTGPMSAEAMANFQRQHPVAHLHLQTGLVAGEVDWNLRVAGCCQEGP